MVIGRGQASDHQVRRTFNFTLLSSSARTRPTSSRKAAKRKRPAANHREEGLKVAAAPIIFIIFYMNTSRKPTSASKEAPNLAGER